MKSSDESFSTMDTTFNAENIEIPEEVKVELIQSVDKLKELLKDEPAFFDVLISKCLLVGRERGANAVDITDIEQVIKSKFDTFDTIVPLTKVSRQLITHLCLKTGPLQELIQNIPSEFYMVLRNSMEFTINEYLQEDVMEIVGDSL